MDFKGIADNAGWIVLGMFYLYTAFDKQRRQLNRDNEETAKTLIDNLKLTTEIQAKKITAMETREIDTNKIVAGLQGQIKILTDILQGKDPETQRFVKQIPGLVEDVKANKIIAETNEKMLGELTLSINKVVDMIPLLVANKTNIQKI